MNPAPRSCSLLVGLSILLTFFLSGCGALVTYEVSQREHVLEATKRKPDLSEDKFLVDMAKRYGLMALFAQTAYREDLNAKDRDDRACDYLDPLKPGSQAGAWMHMPRNPGALGGWERYRPDAPAPERDAPRPCVSDRNGLFYETYVHKAADGKTVTKAVIAFRGTENRSGQWFWDWKTNLTAAFGFEPAQYAYVRDKLPALIQMLKKLGPDVKIYSVGHSLGGGLAQLAAYVSTDVEEAFIFNASPVTGWTWVVRAGQPFKAYPRIHRITQGGEALELPRFAASLVTKPRFGRHDVRIHFNDTEDRGAHSMQVLACGFAELLLKKDAADAEHDYPIQFIADNVLTSPRVQGMNASQAWQKRPGPERRVCDFEEVHPPAGKQTQLVAR